MPHPARDTVTLRDVAAAAGVSLATASRVLGASSRTVAPEYRERVLAAAERLRYTPGSRPPGPPASSTGSGPPESPKRTR
ncbi:LacI family DNA-binding transcriptional regulator [Amycolatopsis tolypomycina]|uniref:Regulatory protein, lacI family n=2 Tax=Amycolatopsis tolypomycina TaxID=208445 RepID=A0A1H4XRS8_9PSEU|nr:LacI family DNA-binding transcriptional regulator [Amycolatopsis tolypomycina]SED07598.1 regulatory protein, lacI family [Amycolatopsis tolypomycina]